MTNKLRFNKKKAIEECKILWQNIIDNHAMSKYAYLNSEAGKFWKQSHQFESDCPLCEYTSQFPQDGYTPMTGTCSACPLTKKFGKGCARLGYTSIGDPKQFAEIVKKL